MDYFDNWQDYWDKFLFNRYGKEVVQTEDDLFLQVARTENRKRVTQEIFDRIIALIKTGLDLDADDILVDLCCGNGLFTYELKDCVKQITGVDFSKSIIETANKFKKADNISYHCAGAVDFMKSYGILMPGIIPSKYLMNDALAYFPPNDFKELVFCIKSVSPHFKFLIRGVPNDELKWNYYNTPERKQFYANLQAKGDLTNDGLGTWWQPQEIKRICDELGLNCEITNQQLPVSNFRMDFCISI